jgi:hypothetical protein
VSTDVAVERRIERPREEVAAYASDWRNDEEWIGALDEVRLVQEEPLQVARVAGFLGKRIEYVNEVVEHEPGRRLVMRSVKAPFPMTVTYEFEDAGNGGSVMRIRTQGCCWQRHRTRSPATSAGRRLPSSRRTPKGTWPSSAWVRDGSCSGSRRRQARGASRRSDGRRSSRTPTAEQSR